MRKKLAIGLFCAVLCGVNLAVARSLEAQKVPDCWHIDCVENATCTALPCSYCIVISQELKLGWCENQL